MKKTLSIIGLLLGIICCIAINIMVNDVAYTIAFIIYCVFSGFCTFVAYLFSKKMYKNAIKKMEEKNEECFKEISNWKEL